jgi:hypothetical protein
MPRECEVVFAGIGSSDQDLLPVVKCDDGAYDLERLRGSPEEIGKAIGESLAESDALCGRNFVVDNGGHLYLTLKILFREAILVNKELRKAQLIAGVPALEPAYCIVRSTWPHVYWSGSQWTNNAIDAKLYPTIKDALDDNTVPPTIAEVIRHSGLVGKR